MSPELLSKKYNEKTDIWSLGVLSYIMFTGTIPFNGNNNEEIFESILNNKFTLEIDYFKFISSNAKKLIKSLLIVNYKKWPSALDILEMNILKNIDLNSNK